MSAETTVPDAVIPAKAGSRRQDAEANIGEADDPKGEPLTRRVIHSDALSHRHSRESGNPVTFARYPEYKDSSVKWLGEVPAHWAVARSSAVARTHRRSVTPNELEGVTVFHYSIPTVQELSTGIEEDGSSIDSNKLLITCPQLLVSKLNPHKQTLVLAQPQTEMRTVASTEFVPLIPHACDIHYLHYVWQSNVAIARLLSRVESATRSHQRVNPDDISKAAFAWPPLDEQVGIVTFLDRETAKIDALIAEQEKLIALLKEKRQALISHAVTKGLDPNTPMKDSGIEWLGQVPAHWETLPLRAVAMAPDGLFDDGDWIESKDLSDDGIRYITTGNVGIGFYKEQGSGFISEETFNALGCTEVRPGDILISRLNLPIGRSCVVPDLGKRIVTSVDNVIVRASDEFDRRFLVYRLSAVDYLAQASNLASGATMQRLGRKALGQIRLCLPPLHEQSEIAGHLDSATARLDGLIAEAEYAIALFKERRAALISAAVTGKIDVRGSATSNEQDASRAVAGLIGSDA